MINREIERICFLSLSNIVNFNRNYPQDFVTQSAYRSNISETLPYVYVADHYASVNSKCQHHPPATPSVLHLLLAQVTGFVQSELPGGCPGLRPTCIIYYQKYQVVS